MKRSKYGVRMDADGKAARTVDNILFASQLEAERYKQLKLLEKAKAITQLELQPRFALTVDGKALGYYVADFRYHDKETQYSIIEDCKGVTTDIYRWKKKHFEAQTGWKITEIRK